MVFITTGEVDLGPRRISAVPGWTPPKEPMGMTPNQGQGTNQNMQASPLYTQSVLMHPAATQ